MLLHIDHLNPDALAECIDSDDSSLCLACYGSGLSRDGESCPCGAEVMSEGEARRIARRAIEAATSEPIPMVLHCPECGTQHVDKEETEEEHRKRLATVGPVPSADRWNNPPHKSHLCHGCGIVWRPADVPTVGVEKIQTKGNTDTWRAE